jgi:hypothetical protein
LVGAALFALICIEVGTALAGLFAVNGVHRIEGAAAIVFLVGGHLFGTGAVLTPAALYQALAIAPAVGLVILLVSAATAHFAVVIVTGGRTAGFRRTLRLISLASVVHVLNWIPVVGLPLNVAALGLAAAGLARAHGIGRWRAAAAAFIPAVAVLAFLAVIRFAPE